MTALGEETDELDKRVLRLLQELDDDEQTATVSTDSETSRGPGRTAIAKVGSKSYVGDSKTLRDLERMRHDVSSSAARVEDAKVALDVEEQRLRTLRSKPGIDTSFNKLLLRQEQEVEKAWTQLTAAEASRDGAELALSRLLAVSGPVQQRMARAYLDASELASRRQLQERMRGAFQVQKALHASERIKVSKAADAAMRTRQEQEAGSCQDLARSRLRNAQECQKRQMQVFIRMREEDDMHHASRVLQLKSNIESTSSQIRGQNESQQKKRTSLENEREKCKLDLLSQGVNPYEVFLLQDAAADAFNKQHHAAAARTLHNEKTLQRLLRK